MDSDTLIAVLLVTQGVLGGIDTLFNHEFLEGLPHRRAARREIALHSMREAIYAMLFAGVAWFAWHGALAAVIAALLAAELLVTVSDELVENRVRVLAQNERVLHFFLTLNYGLIVAVFVPILFDWSARPTGLAPAHHGALSWVLSLLALFSAAWSVRDFLGWRRLGRAVPA